MHTLEKPEFWYSYLASHFGAIGKPLEPQHLSAIFGVSDDTALLWWNDFTGWYEGIIDEADGQVENPGRIVIQLKPSINLVTEFHPGDTYYFLEHTSKEISYLLGNIGPHWMLPMLRWSEALAISRKTQWSAKLQAATLLLLLPGVWLTQGDDVLRIQKTVEDAWLNTGLVKTDFTQTLTANCLRTANDVHWWEASSDSWVTNGKHSRRYSQRDPSDIQRINSLLNDALA